MNKNHFDKIIQTLKDNGYQLGNSEYNDQAFGSWWITINSKPPFRIVHDGRDKTICLEKYEKDEWNCIMADKTITGKHIVNKLKSEIIKDI
jgi:hypothetical protein